MIKSFRSPDTEALFNDRPVPRFRAFERPAQHPHQRPVADLLPLVGRARIRRRDRRLSLNGDLMAAKLLEPIHPGEILLEEFMKPMGVSINALAREIAVPPNRVSDIVNGKRLITADTALRLGKYFGVSPEVWLNLQVDYDLRVAKRTTWLKAEHRVRVHSD
jgi:addiction module HigA family antidote